MRPFLSVLISLLFLSTVTYGQKRQVKQDLGKVNTIVNTKASQEGLRINLSNEADNSPDPGQMSTVLEKILNNIKNVAIDFSLDITYSSKKVKNKSESYLDINYLNLDAIIKFKDDLVFSTFKTDSEKAQLKGQTKAQTKDQRTEQINEQLNKVLPSIKLTTKDMTLVSKVNIANKSEFNLRVCYNYTIGNDYCDTSNDTKLLEFSIFNKSFNKIINLKLKKITLNFDKVSDVKSDFDKYQISGSCEIFENRYDLETADEVSMAVPCLFTGHYSTDPEVGFKINFKYKNEQ